MNNKKYVFMKSFKYRHACLVWRYVLGDTPGKSLVYWFII